MDDISLTFLVIVLCLCIFVGYLLGSIPFGLILTRMAGLGDVRNIGSGNIGATNVLRTGNKKIAVLTLLCDLLKGACAVWLVLGITDIISLAVFAGFGAFLGHLFPVWLKFKGGKGVATYIGVILAFYWPAALVFGIVWLAIAVITRYSSLSALIAMIIVPVFIYFVAPLPYSHYVNLWVISAMSIISILKHHQNIRRLLNGTESKIGQKGKA